MDYAEFAALVWARFLELALVPLRNTDMLWAAVPLVAATAFITLYFARHQREELGWNTAFGNTMVFLFMAMNLIREMYQSSSPPSWENVTSNPLYLTFTVALACAGAFLMLVTYFHLLPKRLAFAIFSAVPINVAAYVMISIVYAGVPADPVTGVAGIVLMAAVWVAAQAIRAVAGAFIVDEGEFSAEEREEKKEVRRLMKEGGPRAVDEDDELIEEAARICRPRTGEGARPRA